MLVALRPPIRIARSAGRDSSSHFSFLAKRFTSRTVFMEIGGADCSLALRAAGYVERAYTVDVSGQFLQNVLVPCNLRLVLCDGLHIPVPEASVDLAWGGGFMDQLDDYEAHEHLKSVRRSLADGGEYFFISGNPERQRLLDAGFSSLCCWLGSARIPWAAHSLVPKSLLRISAIR